MRVPRFFFLILLCLSGSHASVIFKAASLTDAQRKPFVVDKQKVVLASKGTSAHESVMQLRGGAGPLDPLKTAKFLTYFISSQALLMNLTPGFLFDWYGGSPSPLNLRLVQTYGVGILGVLIMAYCLLIRDTPLSTAYRMSEIPWTFECLRNLWKEDHGSAVGFTTSGQVVGLTTSALIMYATTQDYAETVLKAATVFWVLNGAYLIAQPEQAAKMLWGTFPTFDATSTLMTRMIGFNMLAHSGFAGSILFQKLDKLTAFGIGYSSWFIKLISLQLITQDVRKAGFDSRWMYFWILFHGAIVATILL